MNTKATDDLNRIVEDCNFAITEVEVEAQVNESLARDRVDWQNAACTGAEAWLNTNDEGGIRVYVIGMAGATRIMEAVRANLQARGWEDVEVLPE